MKNFAETIGHFVLASSLLAGGSQREVYASSHMPVLVSKRSSQLIGIEPGGMAPLTTRSALEIVGRVDAACAVTKVALAPAWNTEGAEAYVGVKNANCFGNIKEYGKTPRYRTIYDGKTPIEIVTLSPHFLGIEATKIPANPVLTRKNITDAEKRIKNRCSIRSVVMTNEEGIAESKVGLVRVLIPIVFHRYY